MCPSTYSNDSSAFILESFLEKRRQEESFICSYCNNGFKSSSSRSRHYHVCKFKQQIDDNQIQATKDIKAEIENLKEMMKEYTTSLNSPTQTIASTNINNHSNNNNQYVQNNNIIILRDFGNENMEALPKSLISELIIDLKYRELLENLHCDPDFPENHNIKLKSNKRQVIEIYKNDKWNTMTFVNALDEILVHANNIFHNHFRKYRQEISEDMTEEELEDVEEKIYQVRNGLNENFIKPIHTEIQLLLEAHRSASKEKKEETKYVISRPSRLLGSGAGGGASGSGS